MNFINYLFKINNLILFYYFYFFASQLKAQNMSDIAQFQYLCLPSFLVPETFEFHVFLKTDLHDLMFPILNSKNDILCPICLNNCIKPCRPDSCSHQFCRICINKWKKFKKICPYCKQCFKKLINII